MSVKVPRSLMSLKSTVQCIFNVFEVKIAVINFHLWQVDFEKIYSQYMKK